MFGGSALAIKTRTNPPKPPPKPDTLAFAELAATFGARPSAQLKSATVRQPRVRRKKPDGSAVASETLATPTSNRVSVLAREEKLDNAQDEQKVQQDAHEVLDEQNVMEDEQDEEEEHATDLHLAIALYDFHCAEDAERELTFSKNDLVLVTNVSRGIDGWWEVQVCVSGKTDRGICIARLYKLSLYSITGLRTRIM